MSPLFFFLLPSRGFCFFSSSFHLLLKSPRVHKCLPRSVSACFCTFLPRGRNRGQRAAGRVPGGGRPPRLSAPPRAASGAAPGLHPAPHPPRGAPPGWTRTWWEPRREREGAGAGAARGVRDAALGGSPRVRARLQSQRAEDSGAGAGSREACPPRLCHLPRSAAPRHTYPAPLRAPAGPQTARGS